jgi:polyphosphate kinase
MPGPDDTDPSAARFLNREVSSIAFNARVLALAEDQGLKLLERVKFLAIFADNLDEFFQVRVSGLQEQVRAGIRTRSPDGLEPADALREVRARVTDLMERASTVFTKDITPALEEAGIAFPDSSDLDRDDRAQLARVFEDLVYPVLTPLAVDPAHPFPYISNLSLNLAVIVNDPASGEERFARVKVPPTLPRFVALADGDRFVALEQVIAAHLDRLFPGMDVVAHYPFRVTRDTDFELDDEDEDLVDAIEAVLHRRTRFGHTVRLEIDRTMPDEVLDLLRRELHLPPGDVVTMDGLVDLGGLWVLYELGRADLKDPPWSGQTAPELAPVDERPADVFRALRQVDVLVQHPYDSFATSVEAFLHAAASDPAVLAIKQTIYRTAGESTIVASLVEAARNGKQVVALVELKARFDEEANIERARALEEAGAHVVYGLVGLKTHAKVLLVVRQEADGIRRYCHIGTGNYNPKTATLYEDIGLLTADPEIGADLTELFNHLTGYSRPGRYRRLLVAPEAMRAALRDLVRAEAALGDDGRITLKMNSLVDPELIDELYAASNAGAQIELIVRGICCLRPGVPGLSENIRVRSIVGRYLEHSRVYRFGADPTTAQYLIGSADWMPRNLDRRVEALCPVLEPRLQARLDEIFAVDLADDVLSWQLEGDGTWTKLERTMGSDAHLRLRELAVERAHARG